MPRGAPTRLEAVQNAADHARCVADRLVGKPHPYTALPWFWSEQGELRLQIAGLTTGHDRTVAARRSRKRRVLGVLLPATARCSASSRSTARPTTRMPAASWRPAAQVTPDQAADESFDLRAAATARPA